MHYMNRPHVSCSIIPVAFYTVCLFQCGYLKHVSMLIQAEYSCLQTNPFCFTNVEGYDRLYVNLHSICN